MIFGAKKFQDSGKENTAAENFSCVVYNVSIVNCSWTPGREAPKDTQYSLVFRQKDFLQETQVNIPCENERMDSHGRQIGCVSYSPNIDFGKSMNILLEGKSNVTSIGFYENILKLINYVILDPPRNITLNYTSNKLVITWERPKTHNDCKDKCFEYSINKYGEITDVIRGNSYETQNLILDQKITVSMRARYREHYLDRDRKPEWSRWSEPFTFGKYICITL
ncbi:granulocyte-macrophage colony-stimulating factor receptor subunit alpha-like isoform X2 [Pyxicephalus adspersus]|uniref:granulocyte-macrophage colony-stimulating factor receptor subunit alpha-like isoform X2 n=1 Tax=Pyxicephalus adspersus TaxID=30357 RepID=UPI003B5B6D4A